MTASVTRLGSFYAVTPGQGEPEYFPATLDGLCGKHGALQRAVQLSAGGFTQVITRTDGRVTRTVREYADGRETFRSGAELLPAVPPPPPEPAAGITGLAGRRRRVREQVSWPGLSLNDPPCNGA